MNFENKFRLYWDSFEELALPPETPTCSFAQRFAGWVNELFATMITDPTIVSVNQAKILLVDKYFEWRAVVPKSHRARLGKTGHHCLYQVFEQSYERLKVIELSLTPPMLFIPPPPTPKPPPQIAGIFLGELDKE